MLVLVFLTMFKVTIAHIKSQISAMYWRKGTAEYFS